jgi:hypothetical protein
LGIVNVIPKIGLIYIFYSPLPVPSLSTVY